MSFFQIFMVLLQLAGQISAAKGNMKTPQTFGPIQASEEGTAGVWAVSWTPVV